MSLLPLAPSLPLAPVSLLSFPLAPCSPSTLSHSSHPLAPIPPDPASLFAFVPLTTIAPAPTEVVGTLKPSITYPYLPHPLPPEPLWPPGASLGPQEALGAFRSLQQLWGFNQTQGPSSLCSPCFPSPTCP